MITIAFTILIMVIIYHNNRIIFVDKGDGLDPTFGAIPAGHIHQHCSCQSKFKIGRHQIRHIHDNQSSSS